MKTLRHQDYPRKGLRPRIGARWRAVVCGGALLALALACAAPVQAAPAEPEEAQYNVAVALYNAGQLDGALKKIVEREAVALSDRMRARYLHMRGLIHERAGRPVEARAAYAALLERHADAPECQPARLALIYLDHAAGRREAVLAAYPSLRQDGLSPEDRRNLALMRAEALEGSGGDEQETVAAYRQALQAGADSALVNPRLFDLYRRAGRHAELLEISGTGIAGMDSARLALVRAESLLTLKRFGDAAQTSAAVPAEHELGPRAAYVRAQALIGANRPADAIAPLADALARWRELPAPAVAWLTLATCQAQAGQTREASASITQARRHVNALAAAQAAEIRQRLALLEVSLALREDGGSAEAAETIRRLRAELPPERLPELLYRRLYALAAAGRRAELLDGMAADRPVIQAGPHDAPATLLYAQALQASGRGEEAATLLEELVRRKPDAPEAARARIDLAARHLENGRLDEAAALLDAAARADLRAIAGPAALHDVQFNRALLALRRRQPAAAMALLRALVDDGSVAAGLRDQSLRLLAQAHEDAGEYALAAAVWERLSAVPEAGDEPLERMALAHYRAGETNRAAAAFAQREARPSAMPPERLRVYARILLDTRQPSEAALRYERLYAATASDPAVAFECAIAWQRAGDAAKALAWLETAGRRRRDLPEAYALQIEPLQAQARLQARSGDLGASYWAGRILPDAGRDAVESALAALRQIVGHGPVGADLPDRLAKAAAGFAAGHPDRLAIAALHLAALSALRRHGAQLAASAAALRELMDAEAQGLPAGFAATVAPAMIRYYHGEALRVNGKPVEALVEFETVLGVYPYNEWPDAAACGAADCFADLGEQAQAAARFKEVIENGGKSPESARWRQYAEQRLRMLTEGE